MILPSFSAGAKKLTTEALEEGNGRPRILKNRKRGASVVVRGQTLQ